MFDTPMHQSDEENNSGSSNWILMSCQRLKHTKSNSGHKQMHISKLFSFIYMYRSIYIWKPLSSQSRKSI